MEPFYFRSYDKIVGVAHNLQELQAEMDRLLKNDPSCVKWHLEQDHLRTWIDYAGYKALAQSLRGIKDPAEVNARIKQYLGQKPKNRLESSKRVTR
jgi:hypothetical protein